MFENASGAELVFWSCAIAGTLFFALRLVLTLMGGLDHDASGHDFDSGHDGEVNHAPDVAFKLLSVNTVGAFVAMFGWVGLAALKELQSGILFAFLLAWCAGFFTMALTAYLFKAALSLACEGDDFDLEKTVGLAAEVYQRIPAEGMGRIQITVNGILRELNAVSEEKQEIPSFTKVNVEKVVDSTTVCVKRAQE